MPLNSEAIEIFENVADQHTGTSSNTTIHFNNTASIHVRYCPADIGQDFTAAKIYKSLKHFKVVDFVINRYFP